MKRLVFDTSSSWVVAGIWTDSGWLGTIEKAEAQSQSKELFVVLEELLAFYQISKSEITELAVGVGPGSYTGLRIGITVAKIWSYAADLPLYQFSSQAILERGKEKNPEIDHPDIGLMRPDDFQLVEDRNAIVPVYSNDHFS